MIGIKNFFIRTADLVIASSAALVTAGLASAIAANQTQVIKYFIPFTVGATGGIRCQVVVPAGGTAFVAGINLINAVTPAVISDLQVASAAFTNALAVAGDHWLEITVTVVNGATAGNVDLQIAQNTSDALALTVLRGACADVTKL